MTKALKSPLLGAHMSAAGGLEQAIIRGDSIGCTAIQLFTSNNRQWKTKFIGQKEQELFHLTFYNSTIQVIVAHARYLINLGSPYKEVSKRSTQTLIEELNLCKALAIPFLVIHPGASLFSSIDTCLHQIAHNIDKALESSSGTTLILLETMAGQGSTVCNTFDQIAEIRRLSKYATRIGVCFDTCHTFAAGYDFRNYKDYTNLWITFDKIIGLEHLKIFHINDSKKELGTRVDRHEHIGKGKIGLKAFQFLFNDPLFSHVPKILETPKDTLHDDVRNIKQIKALINEAK